MKNNRQFDILLLKHSAPTLFTFIPVLEFTLLLDIFPVFWLHSQSSYLQTSGLVSPPVLCEKQLPPSEIIHHSRRDAFIWFLPAFFFFILFRCHFIVPKFSVFISSLRFVSLCLLSITWHQQEEEMEVLMRKKLLVESISFYLCVFICEESVSFHARFEVMRF